MAIFIVIGIYVIQCINTVCTQVSSEAFGYMIKAGFTELIFEIAGVVSIYIRKKKDQ